MTLFEASIEPMCQLLLVDLFNPLLKMAVNMCISQLNYNMLSEFIFSYIAYSMIHDSTWHNTWHTYSCFLGSCVVSFNNSSLKTHECFREHCIMYQLIWMRAKPWTWKSWDLLKNFSWLKCTVNSSAAFTLPWPNFGDMVALFQVLTHM